MRAAPKIAAIAAVLAAAPAPAQGLLGGLGGGSGGLLGGLAPGVASAGVGNVAGLLGYCVKNRLLGSATGADSALGTLAARPGTASVPGYAEGSRGTLLAGDRGLSLGGLRTQAKTRVCDAILRRARTFL